MSENIFECPKCGGRIGYMQKKQILVNNNTPESEVGKFFGLTVRDFTMKTPSAVWVDKMFCKNCPAEVEMFNKSLRDRQNREAKRDSKKLEKLEREKRLAHGKEARREHASRSAKEKTERRKQELQRQLKKQEEDPNFKVDPNLVKNVEFEHSQTETSTFGCLLVAVVFVGVVLIIFNLFN